MIQEKDEEVLEFNLCSEEGSPEMKRGNVDGMGVSRSGRGIDVILQTA
jgi:hypothetical protein